MDRRAQAILGFQIAFLVFAVVLLMAPADKYVLARWQWAADLELPLGRVMIFAIAAFLLVAIDALRQRCVSLLAAPVAAGRHREIAIGIALTLLADFGCAGGFALWHWLAGGEAAVEQLGLVLELLRQAAGIGIAAHDAHQHGVVRSRPNARNLEADLFAGSEAVKGLADRRPVL